MTPVSPPTPADGSRVEPGTGSGIESGDESGVRRAELLAARLDKPMGILGVIFLFVVLGQLLATSPGIVAAFTVLGWVFWAVFVAEFLLRAYIARFGRAFWKRNWWQVVFLLVPFLRFFRALQALRFVRIARFARFGGILSAGVRGSRSAGRLLSSRIGWLAAVTAVVILASSQLLYATGTHDSYADALFEAAMATITGSGLTPTTAFSRILQVLLAVYSVAVFATLAGSLGAFFLRGADPAPAERPGPAPDADPKPATAHPAPAQLSGAADSTPGSSMPRSVPAGRGGSER